MTPHVTTPRKIYYGWWIVSISMIALATSPAPFIVGSLGLFMKPLGAEFGWSRAEVSTFLLVLTISASLCFPIIGRLLDRFGVRAVVMTSMLAFALCLAAIPTFVSEYWHFMTIIVLIGVLGAGANTVSYIPLFSLWFDKYRGLAIGIGVSGMGLGFLYVPVLVQFMIDHHGWRSAYYALSALILFISLPILWKWLRNTPTEMGLTPDGIVTEETTEESNYLETGLRPKEVLRTREFWMLAVIFTTLSFVLNGCMAHVVPMLTDRGMQASTAALVAASIGGAAFISRILIGYLVDHFFAPYVAVVALTLSTIGLSVFAFGASGLVAAMIAGIMIGISYGSELDLMGYLVTRYFGLRYCGTNNGLLLMGILLGGGFGPLLYGLGFDMTKSYMSILIISAVANAIIVLIAAMLKRYPDWNQDQSMA